MFEGVVNHLFPMAYKTPRIGRHNKVQPFRSVLYRSAAEMALQLGKTDEAIELATEGLSQCFHKELRQELLDVLERARRTTRIGGERQWIQR